MSLNPLDFTSRVNWAPAALAAGVLVMGYVVGPALGRLLSTVDDNLADFLDVSDQP